MADANEIQPALVAGFTALTHMNSQEFQDYVQMEGGDTNVSKAHVSYLILFVRCSLSTLNASLTFFLLLFFALPPVLSK